MQKTITNSKIGVNIVVPNGDDIAIYLLKIVKFIYPSDIQCPTEVTPAEFCKDV